MSEKLRPTPDQIQLTALITSGKINEATELYLSEKFHTKTTDFYKSGIKLIQGNTEENQMIILGHMTTKYFTAAEKHECDFVDHIDAIKFIADNLKTDTNEYALLNTIYNKYGKNNHQIIFDNSNIWNAIRYVTKTIMNRTKSPENFVNALLLDTIVYSENDEHNINFVKTYKNKIVNWTPKNTRQNLNTL